MKGTYLSHRRKIFCYKAPSCIDNRFLESSVIHLILVSLSRHNHRSLTNIHQSILRLRAVDVLDSFQLDIEAACSRLELQNAQLHVYDKKYIYMNRFLLGTELVKNIQLSSCLQFLYKDLKRKRKRENSGNSILLTQTGFNSSLIKRKTLESCMLLFFDLLTRKKRRELVIQIIIAVLHQHHSPVN